MQSYNTQSKYDTARPHPTSLPSPSTSHLARTRPLQLYRSSTPNFSTNILLNPSCKAFVSSFVNVLSKLL